MFIIWGQGKNSPTIGILMVNEFIAVLLYFTSNDLRIEDVIKLKLKLKIHFFPYPTSRLTLP